MNKTVAYIMEWSKERGLSFDWVINKLEKLNNAIPNKTLEELLNYIEEYHK